MGRVAIAWFFLLLLTGPTHAFTLSALGGIDGFHVTGTKAKSDAADLSFAPKITNGAGLGLGFNLAPVLELEIDMMWMDYAYRSSSPLTAGYTTTNTWSVIQVPFIFRFVPNRILSVGAGIYMGIFQGKVRTVEQSATSKSTSSRSFETANLPFYDLGVLMQLELRWPIGRVFFLGLDSRFLISGINFDTTDSYSIKSKQFQGFVKMGVSI